jgi:peptidoglycan/LPS O-acetylase OafA/YrhL
MRIHFRELDGIRGLLAFIIILFHLGLNPLVGALTSGLIPEGRYELAVDGFFTLSGFVLCHVSTGRRPDLLRFLAGRAFRMLPVAAVSLGLCLPASHSAGDPATLIANLILVQLFFGLPHLNRVAWSACSEMWMPALLSVGAWFGRKQGRALLWALLLLMWALAGFACSEHVSDKPYFIDILRSFAGLSSGFLLCMLFPVSTVESASPAPAFLPKLLLFAAGLIMVIGGKYGVVVYAFPALAGFAIVGFLHTKTFLSGSVCQFLGARSYALYMMHWPVLLFFSSFFGASALKGNVGMKLAIIVSSLVLAELTHRYVELPFLRLRARLMPVRA